MKLSDLEGWGSAGDARADLIVHGATDDSRQVRYGYVFFARPGLTVSGLDFIAQAVAGGAQAVVVPEGTPDEAVALSDYERTKVAVLRHPDVPGLYARTVSAFHPERPDIIAGVTGTNGKTSVVSFLKDIWAHAGHGAMSLGTLGLRSRGRVHTDMEATLTTFDPGTLHQMLSEIRRAHGVSHLAMEVSSHALDQRRVDGLQFDAAAFTNLSRDHLDYHGTMEAYLAAKLRLFTGLLKREGTGVVNTDDPHGAQVVAAAGAPGRKLVTFGSAGNADLRRIERRPDGAGQIIRSEIFGKEHTFRIPVAGAFQMENALAALGLALATGVDLDAALAAAERLEPIPGRIEEVATLSNGALVYVDYAHTPAALETVLASLRPHVEAGGKLRVLFGCGGDRDAEKRPLMGRAAMAGADRVYVTDDNPRSEAPEKIRKAVLEGAPGAVDAGARDEAIARALGDLGPKDVLVVAGKGHEDYQILPAPAEGKPKAVRKTRFSDREVILEAVRALKL